MTTPSTPNTCGVCNTPKASTDLTALAKSFTPETACKNCIDTFLTTGHWTETPIITATDSTGTLHRIEDLAPHESFVFTTCNTELETSSTQKSRLGDIPADTTRCSVCNWTSTSMYGTQE